MKTIKIAAQIWFIASAVFGIGCFIYSLLDTSLPIWSGVFGIILALIGSLPFFFVLLISLLLLRKINISVSQKKWSLFTICVFCCAIYGIPGAMMLDAFGSTDMLTSILIFTSALLVSAICGLFKVANQLNQFFNINNQSLKSNHQMETTTDNSNEPFASRTGSNKILIKAIITGVLILVMLIPTIFISNLVRERQSRQAEVVNEVSDKWAQSQKLTGPFIFLPYKIINIDEKKKVTEQLRHLIILPDVLDVNGQIFPEIRLRSIYKVLLYRASLNNTGNFKFKIPKEIDNSLVQWQDAKICYGLSDFKGIEERMVINFDGTDFELSPGLPSAEISEKGLSASIPLSALDSEKKLNFKMKLKIKGSEQLQFVPLAGDSRFTLQSDWASPSFDGSNLPSIRTVNDSGFTATWTINKANLPFGILLKDFKFDLNDLAFGVTMVQPADGYAKTDRSIKYAILFISLTFSLFFIIELLQKKSIHPVQYILIGLALIIFYTLLLSMSEFIPFDFSYMIAAIATILLISFYAFSHFRSLKTASVFGSVLAILYGFTFVLIRLEDTALLLGSIGLFIILALAMYASKKINWYGDQN